MAEEDVASPRIAAAELTGFIAAVYRAVVLPRRMQSGRPN
jgi:hypothetical protein